ncbi:hypothetical protein CWATWH0005_5445 [Crocosphaera watsonii WH 0005]|uniref:Uncharacterized protein n=1 Tax=Crocosphaera watsonii WH 0005 TaxID=423472 RepID=T2IM50_CROWT|nr:hypothetical protein CWATWH0005_5445 [Crocosphaera watsonii WH 0005]
MGWGRQTSPTIPIFNVRRGVRSSELGVRSWSFFHEIIRV